MGSSPEARWPCRAMKLAVATMTVSGLVIWLIVGILSQFAGVVMFGERVLKILARYRPPPT